MHISTWMQQTFPPQYRSILMPQSPTVELFTVFTVLTVCEITQIMFTVKNDLISLNCSENQPTINCLMLTICLQETQSSQKRTLCVSFFNSNVSISALCSNKQAQVLH